LKPVKVKAGKGMVIDEIPALNRVVGQPGLPLPSFGLTLSRAIQVRAWEV